VLSDCAPIAPRDLSAAAWRRGGAARRHGPHAGALEVAHAQRHGLRAVAALLGREVAAAGLLRGVAHLREVLASRGGPPLLRALVGRLLRDARPDAVEVGVVAHVQVVRVVRLVVRDDDRGQPLVHRGAVVGDERARGPGLHGRDLRRRDLVERGVLPHVQVVRVVRVVVALHHRGHPAVAARLVAALQPGPQEAALRGGARGRHDLRPAGARGGAGLGGLRVVGALGPLQRLLLLLHALQLLLLLDELLVLELELLRPLLLQHPLLQLQALLLLHELLLAALALVQLRLQVLVLLLELGGLLQGAVVRRRRRRSAGPRGATVSGGPLGLQRGRPPRRGGALPDLRLVLGAGRRAAGGPGPVLAPVDARQQPLAGHGLLGSYSA